MRLPRKKLFVKVTALIVLLTVTFYGKLYSSTYNLCPSGLSNTTEDLMCKKPIPFVSGIKNPCWYSPAGQLSCLPYFLIIGMQKCGTTDLYAAIAAHDDVVVRRKRWGELIKEIHFFDAYHYGKNAEGTAPHVNMTFSQYTEKFQDATESISKGNNKIITGEATPGYMWRLYTWPYYPQNKHLNSPRILLPDLVRHILPDVKLIVILRDPVERTRSSYFYFHRRKDAAERFDSSIKEGLNHWSNCIAHYPEINCLLNDTFNKLNQVDHIVPGMYYYYINEWLKVFPREQFLIIKFEDYIHHRAPIMNEIFKFLKIRPLSEYEMKTKGIIGKKTRNKGPDPQQINTDISTTLDLLYEFFRPYNDRLVDLLRDNRFTWKKSSRINN